MPLSDACDGILYAMSMINHMTFAKARPAQMIFITTSNIIRQKVDSLPSNAKSESVKISLHHIAEYLVIRRSAFVLARG
jgi:hypothetical protein